MSKNELMQQTVTTLQSPAMMDKFKAALPSHIAPEKFVRVATTALNNAPVLLQCDRASLFNACVTAAQDGLLPDGREAALVKFGNSVAYMPMIGGVLKKIRNSGELKSISANVVYENDKFVYHVDHEGEHFKHEPDMLKERGKPVAAYALALTKDGGVYLEVMTLAQIKQIEGKARSKNIWGEWWEEMAKKTVIRRLSKKLPMSTDLEIVVRRDDEFYDLGTEQAEAPEATPGQPNNLINAIRSKTTEAVEEAEVVEQEEEGLPI